MLKNLIHQFNSIWIAPYTHKPRSTSDIEKITLFILNQLNNASLFVRIPIKCLSYLFLIESYIKTGQSFSKIATNKQTTHISSWKTSPLFFKQKFITFFESFFILFYFERLDT